MPRGPKGEYRPADVIGCAVHVARIATGEVRETGREPVESESDMELSLPEVKPEKKK